MTDPPVPAPAPDESAQPPPTPGSDGKAVPEKQETLYTPEQRREFERLAFVGYDKSIHYQQTLVEALLPRMLEVIPVQMFKDIANGLITELNRERYLTKNKHRQATQLVANFKALIQDGTVEAAIKQSLELDKFSEWLWRQQRTELGQGVIKYVETLEAKPSKV